MITGAHAMPFINQPVSLDMMDGTTKNGILHTVTNDGLYLRPMSGARLTNEVGNEKSGVQELQQLAQSICDVKEAFFPFLFFPFFFLRGIRPFGFFW